MLKALPASNTQDSKKWFTVVCRDDSHCPQQKQRKYPCKLTSDTYMGEGNYYRLSLLSLAPALP